MLKLPEVPLLSLVLTSSLGLSFTLFQKNETLSTDPEMVAKFSA